MSRQGCKSTRGQLQCPQIPTPPHPTTHTRAGSQLGPRARRLGLPHGGCSEAAEGQIQTEERVWCEVISAPYCVYSGEHQGQVSVLTWCTHGRGQGRWWLFPGLDGVLVPLNCLYLPFLPLSLTHTNTHALAHVCQSVVEEVVCRWLLIGPQGPGGWVMGDTNETVCVFEIQTVFVAKVMVQRS